MTIVHSLLILLVIMLPACATHKPVTDGPSIWCNKSYTKSEMFHPDALDIARKGYIYSLASSLALENDPAWFKSVPQRLIPVDRGVDAPTDFLATTFELRNLENPELIDEVIIAYAGSNSLHDWIAVNLPTGGAAAHYEQGRLYAKKIAAHYRNISTTAVPPPLVVTGASLGGGIAVHVTKHTETHDLISKAWVFNSSPKTLVGEELDERIWAASMKGEVLYPIRRFFGWAPGLAGLGITAGHSFHGYYLVQSNAAFEHYNYVLTRNLLHAADSAMKAFEASEKMKAEPIAILEQSSDRNCMSPAYQMPAHMRW